MEATTPAGTEEASVWRSAVLGAGVGFVVLTLAAGLAGVATGIGGASAVGLAVFVGAWGGLGFGFMMGGSVTLGRRMDIESTDRSTHL